MMHVAGSLQLSPELGIRRNRRCNKEFKILIRSPNLRLLSTNLSSTVLTRESSSIQLAKQIYQPSIIPSHINQFKCTSLLNPGQAFGISSVKYTATALTRSYNALQGSPLVLKLLPAVGVIAFALWGLGPLMRQSRNIFLQKSDSSWSKSNAHYVLTSYLQPLLLWSGATLICSALDPVVLPSEASQIVKLRLLNFVRSLSTVLALAYCLSSMIQQAQKFFMELSDAPDTRNMGFDFAGKAIYTAVWVAAVSLFMELLGFSTQKWLTAGGFGTVLLTLAGREIFTNFLSSAMIHATRPFVVNEWIQTKIEGYEVSGTVEHVGWWSPTIIRGEDREAVHIPNHKFTVNVVRNLTQKTHWRIKTHLAISHLDVNKINNIVADMRKVLAKNPHVEHKKLHRRVFLDNINPENQALLILISCFVKTSHFEEYLCVKEAICLDLLRVISHHRARLATPIRTVQKIYSDPDLENIPFAESVFTRGGAVSERPLLLIEPPYKINGEDRSKTRSVRTNGEQDGKATTRPPPDGKVDAKGAAATVASDSKAKDAPLSEESNSDLKSPGPISDSSSQTISSNKQSNKKAGLGNARQNSTSENPSASVDKKPGGGVSSTVQSKQEGGERVAATQAPPSSRPALEENIVLGVALEGSKRTLPIEEEMAQPPSQTEEKELATSRNNAAAAAASAEKDNSSCNQQLPSAPSSSGDQRHQRG